MGGGSPAKKEDQAGACDLHVTTASTIARSFFFKEAQSGCGGACDLHHSFAHCCCIRPWMMTLPPRQAGHIHPGADGPCRRRPQAPHEGDKREHEALRERLGVAHHRPGIAYQQTSSLVVILLVIVSTVTRLRPNVFFFSQGGNYSCHCIDDDVFVAELFFFFAMVVFVW